MQKGEREAEGEVAYRLWRTEAKEEELGKQPADVKG